MFTKLYLIYSFYVDKYDPKKPQSKEFDRIFYEFSQGSHGGSESQQIQQFKASLEKTGGDPKKNEMYLEAYLNHHFVSENINSVMLSTEDPKLIANITAPLHHIFKGINSQYNSGSFKNSNIVYIVAVLEPSEEKKLNELLKKDRFMSFAIFMRGFTQAKEAQAKLKTLKSQCPGKKVVKFIVSFLNKKFLKKEGDQGYYICKNSNEETHTNGDVLFNIMNTFKVTSKEGNEVELEYGYLPRLLLTRYLDQSNRQGEEAAKVMELCESISRHFIRSQSSLLRLMGRSEDSVKVSNIIIGKSSPTCNGRDDIERQNLIYSHMDDHKYEEAMRVADEVKGSFLLKTKKLEILFEQNQIEEAKALISELSQNSASKKKQDQVCCYTIELLAALIELKEHHFNQARRLLRDLQSKMVFKYENNYEIIGRSVIAALDQASSLDKLGAPSDLDRMYSSCIDVTARTIKASKLRLRNYIN